MDMHIYFIIHDNANDIMLFSWASNSLEMVTIAMKLKDICSLEEEL